MHPPNAPAGNSRKGAPRSMTYWRAANLASPTATLVGINAQQSSNQDRNLPCEKRRDGVADLHELLRAIALKEVVVRKCLQSGGLADCQASALHQVGVDEVVAVLRDMARHRRRRTSPCLDPEAVGELTRSPVPVIGREA